MFRYSTKDMNSAAELNNDWKAMVSPGLPYVDLASLYYEEGKCHDIEHSPAKRMSKTGRTARRTSRLAPGCPTRCRRTFSSSLITRGPG